MTPAQLCRQRRHNCQTWKALLELDGAIKRSQAERLPELDRQFSRHRRENLLPVLRPLILKILGEQAAPEMPKQQRRGRIRDCRKALSSRLDEAAQVREQPRFVDDGWGVSTGRAVGSLSKIAQREYGNANAWNAIYDANRDILKDPDKIFPGQKLKIPPK